VSDADEIEHMLRRAGIEHVWSRDDGQLCLNIAAVDRWPTYDRALRALESL
jgi:hypothetical protein